MGPQRDGDFVNDWNSKPSVVQGYTLPSNRTVAVIDSTIRKLDYTAGVTLSTSQRVELAMAAEALGASETFLNNLHFDPSYVPAAREILARRTTLKVSIQTFLTDRWQEGLDVALAVEPDYCEVEARTSPEELDRDGSDTVTMAARLASALEYGAAHGAAMTAGFMDCTRADFNYLVELINRAIEGGALKVILYDSFGCLTPDAFRLFVQRTRESMTNPVPIGVHVHDSFGLATACTVAGVTGGASLVDCAAYGLPTHLRLAPLEETVLSLEQLFGVRTGIKVSELYEYSRRVEEISGVPRAPYQPVTGEHRFLTDSEDGLAAYLSGHEALARPYPPQLLGRSETPIWSLRSTSRTALIAKFDAIGIAADGELLTSVEHELIERLERIQVYPAWLSDDEVTEMCRAAARSDGDR